MTRLDDSLEVVGCGDCLGAWLDEEAAALLANARFPPHLLAAEVIPRTSRPANQQLYRRAAPTGFRCPRCAAPLRARKVDTSGPLSKSSVTLDVCAGHGTFFERRELAAVGKWAQLQEVLSRLEPPDAPLVGEETLEAEVSLGERLVTAFASLFGAAGR